MFPSVKPKDDIPKEKLKEKEWDDRFNKSQVPQYSPLKDKHTKSYRKILTSNKGVDDDVGKKKIKKKTYFEKKLELLSSIKEVHPYTYCYLVMNMKI